MTVNERKTIHSNCSQFIPICLLITPFQNVSSKSVDDSILKFCIKLGVHNSVQG